VNLFDGQTIFAIVFAIVALAIAFGAVAFALWYSGDQQEL
jgi:hypothetical protein